MASLFRPGISSEIIALSRGDDRSWPECRRMETEPLAGELLLVFVLGYVAVCGLGLVVPED